MSSASDETPPDNDADAAGAVIDFIGPRNNYSDMYSELGAMLDVDGTLYADYSVDQYVQSVVDFSSQYGSDFSISYTALNITGRPSKYPEYGDFPETFAMRTYGDWWERAPSRIREIQPQNLPRIPVQDFIVLQFEDYVVPEEIAIFETFSPGAIVRIWAYTLTKTWICLWEASELNRRPPNSPTPSMACRFSPPLKKLLLPTKTIRLEFNHSNLHYFTEIDAVLLRGKIINVRNTQHILDYYERQKKSSIVRKLESMQFRLSFKDNYESRLRDFLANDLDKFITDAALKSKSEAAQDTEQGKSKSIAGLKDMPFEILLNIFGYLDLVSLFRVGQVSRFFYDVSTRPLLYSDLNLKPYWHLASTDLLCTLAKRATVLKKLDLSWCGLFNSISPTEFKKFIQQRGDNLTHLRLNSSKFLNNTCIETLGIVCDNLKELSLRNCSVDPPLLNFSCLCNLKNLERLDLFRTFIEPDLLLTMLENNRKLRHLNLAFSCVEVNMDEVAHHISRFNQQLISLDMWKSHFLSASGLQALSNCHDLEEVDFGWCLREAALGNSLKQLITSCPKLRKLFLGAMRGITDRDVQNIAELCPNLEQLDLMGVLGISTECYWDILVKCKKLTLLDLSFCDNIDDNLISIWTRRFNVDIKHNYMPVDFRY